MTFTGIMLAGGRSRRFGADKAAVFGAHVEAVLRECFPVVEVIREDDVPGCGPLGGLLTALRGAKTDAIFVAACDMPFLEPELIRELTELLADFDAVVPRVEGRFEPLHAAYRCRCLPVVEEQIAAGEYSLQRLIPRLRARIIERPDWDRALTNINTPAEWDAARGAS